MSHLTHFDWFAQALWQRGRTRTRLRDPRRRQLCIQLLEDRQMLAIVTVGNDLDLINGNTASIEILMDNDGGDGISLREAVTAANNTPDADEVLTAVGIPGQFILLGGTKIENDRRSTAVADLQHHGSF